MLLNKDRIKILVVENEIIISEDLKCRVEKYGYTVCGIASSGGEAIELAEREAPDLILMDIILSGELNGIETASIIRSRMNIPVIFITAYADEDKLEKASLALPYGYLLKPFNDRELRVTIEMALYISKVDEMRRETENALLKSEQKYRLLADKLSDVIWTADRNLNITYISPSIRNNAGFFPHEIVGLNIKEFLSPKSQLKMAQYAADELFSEKRKNRSSDNFPLLELEFRRKDGFLVWNEIKCSLLYDESGNIEGFLTVARNINERKRFEEKISQLSELFNYLGNDPLKNINSIVRKTCDILEGACSLYNRLDDAEKSLTVWAGYQTPVDLPKVDHPDGHICYEATIKGGDKPVVIPDLTGTSYETTDPSVQKYKLKSYLGFPVIIKDRAIGSLCIVDTRIRYFTDADIRIISTLARALSIEEERLAVETELKESGRRYRVLSEAAFEGLIITRSGVCVQANWKAAEMSGMSSDDLTGKPFVDLLHPEDRPGFVKNMNLSQPGPLNARIIGANSSPMPVEILCRTFSFEGDDVLAIALRDKPEKNIIRDKRGESETLYQSLFDDVADPIFVIDLETYSILDCNKAAIRAYDYTYEELLTMTPMNLHPSNELDAVSKNLKNAGNGRPNQYTHVSKTGESRKVEVRSQRITYKGSDALLSIVRDISDRLPTKTDRIETEPKSRPCFVHAPTGFFEVDFLNDRFTAVNREICSYTGYTENELLNMSPHELLTEESSLAFSNRLELLGKGAEIPYNPVFEIICKNGERLKVLLTTRFIYRKGEPVGANVIVHDITDKEKIEKALKESEERYRLLTESTSDAVWTFDLASMRFTFVSPSITNQSGYTVNEVINLELEEFLTPESLDLILKTLAEELERETDEKCKPWRTRELELEEIHKEGHTFWVWTNMSFLRDDDGRPSSVIGVSRDITERKKAELAIKENEERLRQVLLNMPVMLDAFDEENRIVVWNKECERVTGYAAEEMVGYPNAQEKLYPDKDYYDQLIREWKTRGDYFINWEMDLTDKSGNVHKIAWSNISSQFQVPGWKSWAIGVDVTKIRQAESRSAAALKEKEILLKEIHHRVKNNMQVITSLLNLQSRKEDDPRISSVIREAQTRISAMSLVHEALYRSESLARIDLGEYINGLIRAITGYYATISRGIMTRVELEHDLSVGVDQAVPCGLVINELLSNSLKHAFPDGRPGLITITGKSDEKNRIELTIKDNGIGIRENIEWNSAASLGLPLVKALVEGQLGGELTMEQNEGAGFRISFAGVPPSRETGRR